VLETEQANNMTLTIPIALLFLAVLVAVAVLARRLGAAPSILLVIAGVCLALVPGLPRLELSPDLVLFGILPPLIYSAGVQMSWREFRFNLRPIALFAIGCVIFTACAVALAVHRLLGLPWPVAFLLGAIVAPPDAVAPLAIARRLGVPRRLIVVLEGEGLANDATALILYRFAIAAISIGLFSFETAAGGFALIVAGEIAYGTGIGWLSLRLRRWVRDPRVEITLSLMTPYVAFWIPAQLGGSGVLAAVATGLYVSWNGPLLIPAATRLQGIFFWDLLIYLLEGFVFLAMGLETRALLDRMDVSALGGVAFDVLLVAAVAIAARLIWVFPAAYLPRWLSPGLARRDPVPPWQWLFFLGFVGIRGVVSLAAALGIPFLTATGTPFPFRDLILFVTFGVIAVTLIGQGLLLPMVVRRLGLTGASAAERENEQAAEHAARREALGIAQSRLEALAAANNIPDEVLATLRVRHEYRASRLPKRAENGAGHAPPTALASGIRTELVEAERRYLFEALREGRITDESRRRIERELDLEEASILCRKEGGIEPPL
jgi:CPA1 family monovalent cation:H+ antiporter